MAGMNVCCHDRIKLKQLVSKFFSFIQTIQNKFFAYM